MEKRPMSAGGGLTSGKLAMANAALAEVLSGKTFYSGDKILKTGTMPNRGTWNGTYAGSDVTIPNGFHNGSGKVSVSGGNKGSWGTTINPGGSVSIPQGWHNGGGVVRANTAASVINLDAIETDTAIADNGIRWTSSALNTQGRTISVYVLCRPDSDQNVSAFLQLVGDGNLVREVEMSRNSMTVLNTSHSGYSNYQIRINQTYHAGGGTFIVRGMAVRY